MNYSDYHFTFSVFNRTETRRFEVIRTEERIEVRIWLFGVTWQCDEGNYTQKKEDIKVFKKEAIAETFKTCGASSKDLEQRLKQFIQKQSKGY